jgi:replication-associated recombination protein RarA
MATSFTSGTLYLSNPDKISDPWSVLESAGSHLTRTLLHGPPGTGKSHIAMRAGVKDGAETESFVVAQTV